MGSIARSAWQSGRTATRTWSNSSNRVSRIAPDGTVVHRWGTEGSGEGEFDFVGSNVAEGAYAAIAVGPDGKVYVSDSANRRVQVFTEAGDFVRQFGSFGNEDGQFVLPADLSADTEGNVYVIDDPLMRISKFGPNGEFLWTADGTADEELDGYLHGADIDSQGRIVVGNDGNRRVMYLDPNGNVVDAFTAGECDVSVDPDGNVYCKSFVADEILVYSPSHELIGSWSGPEMILGNAPSFGANGEILALDRNGGIVELRISLPN